MLDWTAPIEHVDGTPLVFAVPSTGPNPDNQGDYYVKREDGEPFTKAQATLYDVLIVRPNGTAWGTDSHIPVVRNRIINEETKTMTKYVFKTTDTPTEPTVEVKLELRDNQDNSVTLVATGGGVSQFLATFRPGEQPTFHCLFDDVICAAFGVSVSKTIASK